MKIVFIVFLLTAAVFAVLEPKPSQQKVIKIDSDPNEKSVKVPSELKPEPKTDRVSIDKGKPDNTKPIDISKLKPVPPPPTLDLTVQQTVDLDNQKFSCNQKLLHGYGLDGYAFATVEPHKHCPNIKRNCCSQNDQDLSMDFWKTRDHLTVDRYYQAHSLMISYLLGYAKEGTDLSKKHKDKQGVCGNAAKDFEEINTSRVLIEKILDEFKKSIRAMATLRTGFYCNICDYNVLSFIKESSPDMSKGTVQISSTTCQAIVKETVSASYYSVTYIKKLLESLSALIGCESNETEVLTFEIPTSEQEIVKKCFDAKDKFNVESCQGYCGSLKLTEPVSVIDGYIDQLYKFFLRFKKSKKTVFQHPDLNVFVVSPDFEESAIVKDMEELIIRRDFFRPLGVVPVSMREYNSMASEVGGADLWKSLEYRSYYSFMAGEVRLLVGAIVAIFACFWLI